MADSGQDGEPRVRVFGGQLFGVDLLRDDLVGIAMDHLDRRRDVR